jgi:hypothetical protein
VLHSICNALLSNYYVCMLIVNGYDSQHTVVRTQILFCAVTQEARREGSLLTETRPDVLGVSEQSVQSEAPRVDGTELDNTLPNSTQRHW